MGKNSRGQNMKQMALPKKGKKSRDKKAAGHCPAKKTA
jgi:hypothetical protein